MDKYDYINSFNRANYDRITLVLPKGSREKIKAVAKEKGMSMNEYLASLIPRTMVGKWKTKQMTE